MLLLYQVLDTMLSGGSYNVDHITDTWMYGVMLWEMFSLQPPYQQVFTFVINFIFTKNKV